MKARMFSAAVLAGALALPIGAAPTSAQVVVGGGLVNVQVGSIEIIDDVEVRNVLNDLTVSIGVAAQIAANVCGTTVGVIARDLAHGQDVSCKTADQFVDITQ